MTKEECMNLIRKRIKKCESDCNNHVGYTGNCNDWFAGVSRGLKDALELVGMIDSNNNKTKKI